MYRNELCWINPYKLPFSATDALCQLIVSDGDIQEAEERWIRFAPLIRAKFPETENEQGMIESPLREIGEMKRALEEAYSCKISGKLYLKMDSHLAVAGSVKARGGIYEVLKHAENLCLKAGLIAKSDNYLRFLDSDIHNYLKQFTVQVGSTGNLGLSIGIMSADLGFQVKIHMSSDAKAWKKALLREKGVEVIEYQSDYSQAVSRGRAQSALDPMSYFIDDEKSVDLFVGYANAAKRLKKQLDQEGIVVDENHPLIVYIPAGVGGAPGGISYGLKRIFRDNVHCFFVETVTCPSVLIGIATQKFEKASVQDFGISGITEADGLACPTPSGFVTRIMTNIVSGEFTVKDEKLFDYLRLLYHTEDIRIEPSSCAVFAGVLGFHIDPKARAYCKKEGIRRIARSQATHVLWATGGSLVPDDVYESYLQKR